MDMFISFMLDSFLYFKSNSSWKYKKKIRADINVWVINSLYLQKKIAMKNIFENVSENND